MKQIIQSFKSGETILEEVPAPQAAPGQLLIKTKRSLVSLGTEKMLVEFGKANLFQKARQQPDKVKMVFEKIKAEGLIPTLESVFKRLGEPLPLGYCNVGEVIAIGQGVTSFSVGDRVANNGPHAEFVSVPENLCALIPQGVSDDEAAFTIIGAIGLQGIRLLNPTFGETIVVTGLGLIGLLAAQLLKANGCRVIGLEVDENKLKIAEQFGITTFNPIKEDPVRAVNTFTKGIGADGVLITASAKSNDIISQAAQISRKRGRIVLVGVIGLNISRAEFYEKELSFQVSCSYGPGRYDDDYEQKGIDYPLPFVRWTEKRNFEAVLQAIEQKNLNVQDLITEKVELDNFLHIYGQIGDSKSIASLLVYDENSEPTSKVQVITPAKRNSGKAIGIVGAGNFTKMTMLPVLKDIDIKYIVSKGGLTAKTLAEKYNIEYSSSDLNDLLSDENLHTVVITTRHNLHADMAIKAIEAGKNVFVEKPLALSSKELDKIIEAKRVKEVDVTVGFNRRFSPHIEKIKKHLPKASQKNLVATMNAGFIPENVWIHDIEVGGGRILGEACHFIDLLSYLSGSKVTEVCMNALGIHPKMNTDNASILLKFENGDSGVINYFANGSKAYSKERLEVYFDEKTIIIDNYRLTKAYGVKGFSKLKTKLDKGHKKQFQLLADSINNDGQSIIPFHEIVNATKASFAAIESLKTKSWVTV